MSGPLFAGVSPAKAEVTLTGGEGVGYDLRYAFRDTHRDAREDGLFEIRLLCSPDVGALVEVTFGMPHPRVFIQRNYDYKARFGMIEFSWVLRVASGDASVDIETEAGSLFSDHETQTAHMTGFIDGTSAEMTTLVDLLTDAAWMLHFKATYHRPGHYFPVFHRDSFDFVADPSQIDGLVAAKSLCNAAQRANP
jgi:hypothetical protein